MEKAETAWSTKLSAFGIQIVSAFWKGRLKSIFLNREKCRPQGGPPTASPAQRVAVGKEEQGSGRMTSF
ncbi:hypothetical protein, partial [uncultured Intestinimonas sp.]|uniref:hypothetical protein n=1 Tax=uncultured Intestinimonas sp. TaxID=1689265 RepID=UPI0025ED4E98